MKKILFCLTMVCCINADATPPGQDGIQVCQMLEEQLGVQASIRQQNEFDRACVGYPYVAGGLCIDIICNTDPFGTLLGALVGVAAECEKFGTWLEASNEDQKIKQIKNQLKLLKEKVD